MDVPDEDLGDGLEHHYQVVLVDADLDQVPLDAILGPPDQALQADALEDQQGDVDLESLTGILRMLRHYVRSSSARLSTHPTIRTR